MSASEGHRGKIRRGKDACGAGCRRTAVVASSHRDHGVGRRCYGLSGPAGVGGHIAQISNSSRVRLMRLFRNRRGHYPKSPWPVARGTWHVRCGAVAKTAILRWQRSRNIPSCVGWLAHTNGRRAPELGEKENRPERLGRCRRDCRRDRRCCSLGNYRSGRGFGCLGNCRSGRGFDCPGNCRSEGVLRNRRLVPLGIGRGESGLSGSWRSAGFFFGDRRSGGCKSCLPRLHQPAMPPARAREHTNGCTSMSFDCRSGMTGCRG
jgi:hypothetical protein